MYNKQGFIDGQRIRASHLNHMEEGILDASNGYISIEQTSESTEDGGENVIKATRADGTFDSIVIRNGSKGSAGPKGDKGDTGATGPQGEKGDTGATGPQGEKGDKGDAGENGYTPVKGTDYWTAADKSAMVSDVLAALPTWTGGSY